MSRSALVVAAVALSLASLAPANAWAGDYVVAQCHPANPAHEALVDGADRGDYGMRDECTASPENSLKVISTSAAPSGHRGHWYWEAPSGTRIVAVDVEAKLRRDEGHKARLFVADSLGQPIDVVATGTDGATNFEPEHWAAPPGSNGAARFYAALVCDNNGASCPLSSEAKTFVRHVELTLRDVSPPTVTLDGDAVTPGWKQGDVLLKPTFADTGGGLLSWYVSANGQPIDSSAECAPPGQGDFTLTLAPCPEDLARAIPLKTGSSPFHDGPNEVQACAFDIATHGAPNRGCRSVSIHLDNTPPILSFKNEENPHDPELIAASAADATSGLVSGSAQIEVRPVGMDAWSPLPTSLADGSIAARVDSESHEPGPYEFRVSVSDSAGNEAVTQLRADRRPMQLEFPLKQRVELDAFFPGGQRKHLARYRQPGRVSGFLRQADGSPIAGQRLVIVETFNRGSLIRQRTSRAKSRADGSFRSTIPGGPSRTISVRYVGSRRYLTERAPSLDYNVRSRVALNADATVKAGTSARFRGAVGRYFARMPAGGKLVELQYKKRAKTWNTANEALGTADNGRISLAYRFRRYYVEPVTFTFRLKVTRESGWPYRLPATSKPVKVTVLPVRD